MKPTLTIFLILLSLFTKAQNYRCYNPATKRFYTNSLHYIKGMRIDSVRYSGSDTIYYPFHSYRGKQKLDTLGASWLGKTMTIKPDWTTLIINQTNDTIVIHTKAQLYDSWLFYKDTSANYYKATVFSIDTSTIMNVTDTVKWITLNSYNAAGVNTTDILNNIVIGLSKDHGLIQCPDLGVFPALRDDYLLNSFTGNLPTKDNLTFKLIDFANPDYLDFYNYNAGDAFLGESVVNNDYSHSTQTLVKVIAAKQSKPDSANYTIEGWYKNNFPNAPATTKQYKNSYTQLSSKFIDTLIMPEEWHSNRFYFYDPDDSSFCVKGLYKYVVNAVIESSAEVNDFEPGYTELRYKKGLGEIYREMDVPSGNSYWVSRLLLVYKGYECGPMPYLSVEKPSVKAPVIYPNPATDKLYIQNDNLQISTAQLLNGTGQIIRSSEVKKLEPMDISNVPAGIYLLKIADINGGITQQKLTILK